MASHIIVSFALIACTLCLITSNSSAQLTTDFYSKSCPNVFKVVRSVVFNVVSRERRMGGSLLRLHYHDCMVHGCDGSLLLDDTPTFKGEKTAAPNYNSARGFEVVDLIKAKVEKVCPGVVSCADILAIAAHASVSALGGPFWYVKLGRRDSKTASFTAANSGVIPSESSSLNYLIKSFHAVGLSVKDMVALSGAHTLGQARCVTFRPHVYNGTNIDPLFAIKQQSYCPFPAGKGDNNLVPLDIRSPYYFDTYYYYNLINKQGLLHSDQQYYSGGMTDAYVYGYYKNPKSFFVDFAAAIIKMGDISPLTGHQGEIRKNCRVVNS